MSLYAVENLDDALDATREFLLPFDRSRWLKLAVVVLFLGVSGTNVFQYSFGGGGGGSTTDSMIGPVEPAVWVLAAAIIGAILLVGLVYALVGSVMEFVFVESLRAESVSVRQYFRSWWGQGLRLFGFRIGVVVFTITTVLVVSAPALFVAFGSGQIGAGALVPLYLVLVPVFVVVAMGIAVVYSFTTVFVVPIMMVDDCGVVAGWRRLWPSIKSAWKQYLTYAIASLVLTFIGGVLFTMAAVFIALLLVLPFGVFAALGAGVMLVWEPLGWVIIAFVVFAYVLTLIAVSALVQVPVQVYLRYFALLVLGDIEPDYDVITDLRTRIRDDDAATA